MSAPRSTVLQRIRAAVHGGPDGRGDDGVSLVELMVSMALLAFVSAIFMAAINGIVQDIGKQSGLSDGQAQVRKVYSMFDKTVREANGMTVNSGGTQVGFDYYGQNGTVAQHNCVRWQYVSATGLLQYHNWVAGAAEPATWVTAATGVVTLPNANVFAVTVPTNAQNEELTVNFGVAQGKPVSTAKSTTSYAAENSATTSTLSSAC